MPLNHGPPLIDATPPRVLFAELVAGALDRTGVAPSPHAAAYLVDLLAARVRHAGPEQATPATPATPAMPATAKPAAAPERLCEFERIIKNCPFELARVLTCK